MYVRVLLFPKHFSVVLVHKLHSFVRYLYTENITRRQTLQWLRREYSLKANRMIILVSKSSMNVPFAVRLVGDPTFRYNTCNWFWMDFPNRSVTWEKTQKHLNQCWYLSNCHHQIDLSAILFYFFPISFHTAYNLLRNDVLISFQCMRSRHSIRNSIFPQNISHLDKFKRGIPRKHPYSPTKNFITSNPLLPARENLSSTGQTASFQHALNRKLTRSFLSSNPYQLFSSCLFSFFHVISSQIRCLVMASYVDRFLLCCIS